MVNSNAMDVDLVVPYFNGHDYIEAAILSATKQTIPFGKIFLVDDGSESVSSEFAKEISLKYGVTYLWKSNGGQGSARNFGISQSEAGLICFLDQDDFLCPDHNEILISEFRTLPKNKGWVSGNFSCCDENGYVYQINANPAIAHQITNVYQMVDHDLFMLPSGTIISSEALRAVGGFDEQFKGYEDDDLFIRLFRAGFSFRYVDKEVYVWRMHGGQTSSSIKMLHSRKKFISKWMAEDFGSAVNEGQLKSSIIRRFRPALVQDVLYGEKKEFAATARAILLEILRDYSAFITPMWRISLNSVCYLPRPVSRASYRLYKKIKNYPGVRFLLRHAG